MCELRGINFTNHILHITVLWHDYLRYEAYAAPQKQTGRLCIVCVIITGLNIPALNLVETAH